MEITHRRAAKWRGTQYLGESLSSSSGSEEERSLHSDCVLASGYTSHHRQSVCYRESLNNKTVTNQRPHAPAQLRSDNPPESHLETD